MLTLVLAVLSVSAAASFRLALPLLALSLFYSQELFTQIPLLNRLDPRVVMAIGISWCLFELFGSKKLLGQRVLQIFQLILSPFVGALAAMTVASIVEMSFKPLWLIGLVGGVFTFVLTLVQVGWFFRLGRIPIWVVYLEDLLCFSLVAFAFLSPVEGGLIALFILWSAIRSSSDWRKRYSPKPVRGS